MRWRLIIFIEYVRLGSIEWNGVSWMLQCSSLWIHSILLGCIFFFIPMLYRNTISTAIRCAHKFIIHFKLFSSISLLIWFCRPISAIVIMIVSAAAQQMWSANNCSIESIYKFNINAWVLNVKQTQIQFADDLCRLWMLPNRPHNRDILAVW